MFLIPAIIIRILVNPLSNVFQKQLTNKGMNPLFINFITYLLLSIFCFYYIPQINFGLLPHSLWINALIGGLLGAMGNALLIKALEKGDLSVLGPINAYKSVVGLIFGIFLINEIPNIFGIAGIILIIAGSYFVLDTTEERFTWSLFKSKEIQFRIGAMVLTAIEAIFIKKIILLSSVEISFILWCWMGALFSFLLLFVFRINIKQQITKPNSSVIRQILFLVLCVGTMQFTTNYTFDHMPVSYALSLFQLSILVSIVLGYKFFNEKDIKKKMIGGIIMIAGSVIVILLK